MHSKLDTVLIPESAVSVGISVSDTLSINVRDVSTELIPIVSASSVKICNVDIA